MSPSKKMQLPENAIRKSGFTKTFICSHFNSFPEEARISETDTLFMSVYVTSGNYNAIKSSRKLKKICESRYGISKKLSDKNMMARFSDECNKPFLWSPNTFEPINPFRIPPISMALRPLFLKVPPEQPKIPQN
ncbi:unnamed protein product [Lepeophtheirus salmonis]|uniref:(salmon louse) hypothetical protein n=1 Tax=Lepeophtheirus salmonis TaxID=72036 RepID=A0A7R8HEN4_LEPSM|nr:unnamed protein product [Lepeophtheirus salmonis]CAF3045749.1 unnamed protein product [Lepeophtheirus salmonis]